eukprot:SAG31_NODE_11349_length_1040_cov_1.168969_2_plen_97_part_00
MRVVPTNSSEARLPGAVESLDDLEEYTVFVQHQSEFDPVQTQFAWAGPAARWACMDLSRIYFWNNVGTERFGSQAVQAAVHLANVSGVVVMRAASR